MSTLTTAVLFNEKFAPSTFDGNGEPTDEAIENYIDAHMEALQQLERLPAWTTLIHVVDSRHITITTVGEYLTRPIVNDEDTEEDIPF